MKLYNLPKEIASAGVSLAIVISLVPIFQELGLDLNLIYLFIGALILVVLISLAAIFLNR